MLFLNKYFIIEKKLKRLIDITGHGLFTQKFKLYSVLLATTTVFPLFKNYF